MPSLKLKSNNIKINDTNIENVPECENGNFAFGYVNELLRFVPAYIGRSTTSLRENIRSTNEQQVEQGKHYTHFKYECAHSKVDAYERECKNYHDYKYRKDGSTSQLNSMHPTGGTCPVENCFQ